MKVNFKSITIAYNEYKKAHEEVEETRQKIFDNETIQNYYRQDNIKEARKEINRLYSNFDKLNKALPGLKRKIFSFMIKDIPEFEKIGVDKIIENVAMERKMMKLADRVFEDYSDMYC